MDGDDDDDDAIQTQHLLKEHFKKHLSVDLYKKAETHLEHVISWMRRLRNPFQTRALRDCFFGSALLIVIIKTLISI